MAMESVSLLTKYSSRNLSEYASIGVPVGALNVVRRVMGDSSRYELDCEGLEQSDQMQYPVSTPSSSTRSESLHREAYNAVFREFGVDYNWSPEYYDVLQNTIGGGKPKMRYYFGENGWPSSKLGGPPETDGEKDALIDALQDRKTIIYKDFIADGTAVLRPGVQRLIDEAASIPGGKMAICSASTKDSCLFVLDNLLGKENLAKFDLILAGDDVPRRKPDPMIYNLASEKLGVASDRCMVIEDSLIGLEAALGASMACVITHTDSTKDQDFAGAVAVYPELGDEGSVQVHAADLLKLIGVEA